MLAEIVKPVLMNSYEFVNLVPDILPRRSMSLIHENIGPLLKKVLHHKKSFDEDCTNLT